MKKYKSFSSKNVQDLEVKFSIYLNRRVFVMKNYLSQIMRIGTSGFCSLGAFKRAFSVTKWVILKY